MYILLMKKNRHQSRRSLPETLVSIDLALILCDIELKARCSLICPEKIECTIIHPFKINFPGNRFMMCCPYPQPQSGPLRSIYISYPFSIWGPYNGTFFKIA